MASMARHRWNGLRRLAIELTAFALVANRIFQQRRLELRGQSSNSRMRWL
jgi:hypothetical protein